MTNAMQTYKEKLLQAKDEIQIISDFIYNDLNEIDENCQNWGYAGNAGHILEKLKEIRMFVTGVEE